MSSSVEESRKRKMNQEVAGEPSTDYSVIPPGVPHVPLSFEMSHSFLLNGPPDPPSENTNATKPFDQIVALHGEMMKNELSALVEKLAEEKAKNTLEKRELQLKRMLNRKDFLERKAEIYRNQAEELVKDVRCAEKTASSLRNKLKEANKRMQLEISQKNDEPYDVDIITLGPVWLNCWACTNRVATVMMKPCRHICICTECQDITVACPMCDRIKEDAVEVYLPYKPRMYGLD